MLKSTMLLFVGITILISGCSGKRYKGVEEGMNQPVNCATAQQDIQTLRQEKARVHDRIAHGATSVAPIGLVTGIITGTQGSKMRVATGKYNSMIDQRIREIKATCGIK
jgi:hypothetical protein